MTRHKLPDSSPELSAHPVEETVENITELLDLENEPQEERIRLAVEAVLASIPHPGAKPALSLRQAAKAYAVPRSTLTDRYNGVQTRQDTHEKQQNLTRSQEQLLVEWAKVQGRRGVPISPTTLADHASDICGKPVGSSWPTRFLERHPDLKVRYSQSLEKCRANNVNRATINKFFDMLEEIITEFKIPAENIYNMDEKGIQLGVGKRVAAIVDSDQKNVYNIEDGNRESVTVIETICANGTALAPTVIFEGKKVDFRWTKKNPCKARRVITIYIWDVDYLTRHYSVSCSPNGWTDQDLGSKWLERDFEPMSAVRNISNGYRLLILDRHNSHCTYRFCKFARDHKIIVICLPSHTTHVLQPCDVGVFGPLASSWKSEVNVEGRKWNPITKINFLETYHKARITAFKPTTIRSAFRKSGIWPLDRDVLDPLVFEPSLNTTTQAAQPIPTSLPSSDLFIISSSHRTHSEPLSHRSNATTTTTTNTTPAISAATSNLSDGESLPLIRLNIPKPLRGSASRQDLLAQNCTLFRLLKMAEEQIQRDHAQKRLMDRENETLRQRLHWKEKKKEDKRTTADARHLTSDEALSEGSKADWHAKIKLVHDEAKPRFQLIKKQIKAYHLNLAETERALAEEEKKQAAHAKQMLALQEREERLWRQEMAQVAKYVEDYASALRKAADKAKARELAKANKANTKAGKAKGKGKGTSKGKEKVAKPCSGPETTDEDDIESVSDIIGE